MNRNRQGDRAGNQILPLYLLARCPPWRPKAKADSPR